MTSLNSSFTIRFLLTLLAALICPSGFAQPEANFHAYDLRCEFASNPLGIDVTEPRLSWKLAGWKRGQKQSAYQIRVFSSTNLVARATPDLWDSGKVVSDETHLIRYAGKTLSSSQQVFWSLRVWDEKDQPS